MANTWLENKAAALSNRGSKAAQTYSNTVTPRLVPMLQGKTTDVAGDLKNFTNSMALIPANYASNYNDYGVLGIPKASIEMISALSGGTRPTPAGEQKIQSYGGTFPAKTPADVPVNTALPEVTRTPLPDIKLKPPVRESTPTISAVSGLPQLTPFQNVNAEMIQKPEFVQNKDTFYDEVRGLSSPGSFASALMQLGLRKAGYGAAQERANQQNTFNTNIARDVDKANAENKLRASEINMLGNKNYAELAQRAYGLPSEVAKNEALASSYPAQNEYHKAQAAHAQEQANMIKEQLAGLPPINTPEGKEVRMAMAHKGTYEKDTTNKDMLELIKQLRESNPILADQLSFAETLRINKERSKKSGLPKQ